MLKLWSSTKHMTNWEVIITPDSHSRKDLTLHRYYTAIETNRRKTTLPNAIPVAAPADKGFFGATIYYENSESLRELLALVITYDDHWLKNILRWNHHSIISINYVVRQHSETQLIHCLTEGKIQPSPHGFSRH